MEQSQAYGWERYVTPPGETYWVDMTRSLVTDVDPTSPSIHSVNAAYSQVCEGHLVNGLLPNDKEVYIGEDEHGTHFYLVDHTHRRVCYRGAVLDVASEYWTHLDYFPNHHSLSYEARKELLDILSYHIPRGGLDGVFSGQKPQDVLDTLEGMDTDNEYRVAAFARIWGLWAAHQAKLEASGDLNVPHDPVVGPFPPPYPGDRVRDVRVLVWLVMLQLARMAQVMAQYLASPEGAWKHLPFFLLGTWGLGVCLTGRLSWAAILSLIAGVCMWIILGRDRRLGLTLANLTMISILLVDHIDILTDTDHAKVGSVTWVTMGLSIAAPIIIRVALRFGAENPVQQV